MDVFSATAIVLRRWYVALPVLVLTAYFAVAQYQSVEPSYAASASVVLLPPPPRAPTPDIIDPEDLQTPLDPAIRSVGGSSARLIGGLVERNLENPATRAQLAAGGASAGYEVDLNRDLSLLSFTVTGTDPVITNNTLEGVVEAASTTLTQVQGDLGATTDAVYRLQSAAPPTSAEALPPERSRALIATVVGGAGLAFFLALLFDSALVAFRNRRRRPMSDPQTAPELAHRPDRAPAASGDHRLDSGGRDINGVVEPYQRARVND